MIFRVHSFLPCEDLLNPLKGSYCIFIMFLAAEEMVGICIEEPHCDTRSHPHRLKLTSAV